MKYLLHGLERHGIGTRAFTENDFWLICADEDVEIYWSRKRFPMYFTVPKDDLRVIVLPDRLNGLRLLFVMYHEIAHHWLHGGDEPCIAFMGGADKKCEAEADALALLALMPTPDVILDDPDLEMVLRLRNLRYQLAEYWR